VKVSIITVALNNAATIAGCIQSVNNQSYNNIEHIVIDGASKDDTLQLIKLMPGRVSKIISEPDRGIYDAMNKGIKLATGDLIGILNADDFYEKRSIIETIVSVFKNPEIDAVYGDVRYVRPNNLNKTVRYYSSKIWSPHMFRFGFMPGHPTFFTYKRFFEEIGYYKDYYRISGDYELLIRFLYKAKINAFYLNTDVVTMRLGGISSGGWRSNVLLNKEIIQACAENGIYTNSAILILKYVYKISEFIFKRNHSGPTT
jgi:glycosyltransferase involved in cell wall biosynthesis